MGVLVSAGNEATDLLRDKLSPNLDLFVLHWLVVIGVGVGVMRNEGKVWFELSIVVVVVVPCCCLVPPSWVDWAGGWGGVGGSCWNCWWLVVVDDECLEIWLTLDGCLWTLPIGWLSWSCWWWKWWLWCCSYWFIAWLGTCGGGDGDCNVVVDEASGARSRSWVGLSLPPNDGCWLTFFGLLLRKNRLIQKS